MTISQEFSGRLQICHGQAVHFQSKLTTMKYLGHWASVMFALGTCAFAVVAEQPGAADWTQFRGPTGQGISHAKGLPVEWSSTKNITWKKRIPGTGWSSPLFVRGQIYLTTAVPLGDDEPMDRSLRAICLDGRSGATVWDNEVFLQDGKTAPGIHSKNSHASPTPIVHDGHLYVHFGHQGTACLSLDGKPLWRTRRVQYQPRHGNACSPIVADDNLIFTCDGQTDPFVIALDCATGKQRWRTFRDIATDSPFSFSTPLLIHVDGKPLVISPGSEKVGAYDPQTGQEVWHVIYPGGYSVVPRPVFGHGLVYVCSGFDKPTLYAIRPDGVGDVTETHVAWKSDRQAPHNSSVLLAGDEIYMVSDDGVGSCLDARTGQVHWTKRLGGNFSASPLLADGVIYFQNETGTACVVKASKEFQQLAKNTLDDIPQERTFASYAVGEGALLLRSEFHLYRIEARP